MESQNQDNKYYINQGSMNKDFFTEYIRDHVQTNLQKKCDKILEEIDFIEYEPNVVKQAILNNDPIEKKLHVIAVISNPCLFARRYILMKEFINRIEQEETNVELYIVELAYGNQEFIITE